MDTKSKFTSFFKNNLKESNADILVLKREIELLKARVKLLEEKAKKV